MRVVIREYPWKKPLDIFNKRSGTTETGETSENIIGIFFKLATGKRDSLGQGKGNYI